MNQTNRVSFSDMPYKRPDHLEVMRQMDNLTERFRSAESAEEQWNILKESEDLDASIETMANLAHVRNTIDTRDEFYDREKRFWNETIPLLNEKNLLFSEAVLQSPFRKELEKKLGSLYFIRLENDQKAWSPEITNLVQADNLLQAEYQKLCASACISFREKEYTLAQMHPFLSDVNRNIRREAMAAIGGFFDAHQEKFDEIFDKMVKNRTEQAKKMGYANYVELAYLRRNRIGYGPADVAKFRQQVIDDLVPLIMEMKKQQAERLNIPFEDFRYYDDELHFTDGNPVPQGTPEEILAAGKQMYTEMSPETAEFIQMMFDMDLFSVLATEGKAPGGYCTHFTQYHCPFIFSNFNGTSGDVDVLTHEAGHAFAFYLADKELQKGNIPSSNLTSPSMEGCETHSMSMEFLASPWYRLFFKEQTPKYELYHGEDALFTIPYLCMVDHFQEIIYGNPDMTPAQRNDEWMKLEKLYRPYNNLEGIPFFGRGAGWQRQRHIYQYPFYYIDYAMAQIEALQIWALFLKDPKTAWKTYLDFVKLAGTKTFVDLVHSAGLKSPMDDGCVKTVTSGVQEWLKEHQI